MPKVISIGNTCLDIILLHADHFPKWGTEIFFEETGWRTAGQGANFAIASGSLGNTTYLISNIGSDPAGARIEAELKTIKRLDLRFLRKTTGSTGFTVSVIRSDGERLFLTFLGHQEFFSLKRDEHKIIQTAENEDIIHISGYYMLPHLREELPPLLKKLRAKNVRISFDPGWPPFDFSRSERANLDTILPHVDYFEPNETELLAITGENTIASAVGKIRRRFSGVLALKRGERGSVIFSGNKRIISKAFKIRALDSTGAGDVFDAAFLTGAIKEDALELCARKGNAAAAILMTRGNSDRSRFPTKGALNSFLEES